MLFNKNVTLEIISKIGKDNFFSSATKPVTDKPFTGWKVLDAEGNVICLRCLMPFREVLEGHGFKGNVKAFPNKLVWCTFAINDSEYANNIPAFDEKFRPEPRHINLLIDVLNGTNAAGYGRGYYGFGEAGTGKTSTAHWLFAVLGIACVQLNCKPQMEVEEMFISHTAKDGKWSQAEGPILKALRLNYPLVIDEMDLAPAEFIPALNNLVEGRKFSVTFCDKMLQAGDNFKVIGFGNTSGSGMESGCYQGRSPLDASSLDRLYKDYYEPLTKERYMALIESHGFEIESELSSQLCDFIVAVNKSVRDEQALPEMISPRGLLGICNLLQTNEGVLKNPLLFAIGSVMSSILENSEYREKVFTLFSAHLTNSVLSTNQIEQSWGERFEVVDTEETEQKEEE